jgi:ATP-dependent Lon protease
MSSEPFSVPGVPADVPPSSDEGGIEILPVMPLRGGTVVFPFAVVPLAVGQPRSVRLIDDVMRADRRLVFVAQNTDDVDLAGPDHVYRVGTIGVVHHRSRSLSRASSGSASSNSRAPSRTSRPGWSARLSVRSKARKAKCSGGPSSS